MAHICTCKYSCPSYPGCCDCTTVQCTTFAYVLRHGLSTPLGVFGFRAFRVGAGTVGFVTVIFSVAPSVGCLLLRVRMLGRLVVFGLVSLCGGVGCFCFAVRPFCPCLCVGVSRVGSVVRLRCVVQADESVSCCGNLCCLLARVCRFRSLMSVLTVFLSKLCACLSQSSSLEGERVVLHTHCPV